MGIRYLLYRLKYTNAKHLNLSKPVDVSIELSSVCNQSCKYCYHSDHAHLPFSQGFMDFFLATKVIRGAAELGVNSLKFNFRGESTLHRGFYTLTRLARELAHGPTFIDRITNSNFKFATDDDDIFRGLANQTKVKVSLDSFVPGVMVKQRPGSDLPLMIKNVTRFYNWPERKTEIVIQAVRTQLNKNEDIEHEAKKLWPSVTVNINDMVTGRVKKDLTGLSNCRQAAERQSCIQAHARLIVNWNGQVTVCCPDIASKLFVGDANTQSLGQIWNGPRAKLIRHELLDGSAFDSEPCKSCPSFESYKGFKPSWRS